jgi:hypothetical protein
MKPVSLDVIAQFVAKDFFADRPGSEADRHELASRIETALRAAVGEEREACAAICDHREQLWRSTEESADKPAQLRNEARSRSIEAAWLSDAIRAR